MNISQHIAASLRAQRRRIGLTIEQTAELAGVSRNTVRNLEHHVSADCSLGIAERVCAVVGLELSVGIRGAKRLIGSGLDSDNQMPAGTSESTRVP